MNDILTKLFPDDIKNKILDYFIFKPEFDLVIAQLNQGKFVDFYKYEMRERIHQKIWTYYPTINIDHKRSVVVSEIRSIIREESWCQG